MGTFLKQKKMKKQNDQKKKNKNQCNRMCPDFPVIAKNYFLPIRLNKKNPSWMGHMTFPAVDTACKLSFQTASLIELNQI